VLRATGSLGQLPSARSGAAAAVLGSSIAVSGGLSADGESTSTVFLFSARGVLTSPSGLPAPVHDAAATAVGHRLLLFGGGQVAGSDEILQVLPGPARMIAALPQPLSDLDAVSISGVAYVVGGWNGSLPNRDIYSLRADGTTTRVGVLPVGVRYPAAAALDGELIVAGGETAAGGPTTSAWAFDPSTRALTRLPNLPAATDHTAGASVAGRFCVLGGERNGVFTDAIVCWAPGESHWQSAGQLPVPLADLRAVSFDGGGGNRGRSRERWAGGNCDLAEGIVRSPRAMALSVLGAAALTVAGCGSTDQTETHTSKTGPARSKPARPTQPLTPGETAQALLGLPPVPAGSSLSGYLMIADRDNNRVIVVSPSKRIVWRFPAPGDLASGQQFAGPDDAFLTPNGRDIITNEEFSDTIAEIALGPRPRIIWNYGHAAVQGSAPGYVAHPDDAYVLPNGLISVADIINCRVLFLNRAGRTVRSIGSAGNCSHDPPRSLDAPNGDTPLPDGGVLVTEIGGWVDRFDRAGRLVYSIRTPTDYPSDAQLLPGGNILVAGFNTPGRIDILTPQGRILWTYGPAAGPGALDRPSLAVELPNGLIAATDDWHHRVVLIDPHTKKIIWQYGHDGQPGSAPGYLDKPDGLQLIG